MNYLGVDMYARNRGSRITGSGYDGNMMSEPVRMACPFCGAATTVHWNRIAEHIERGGFTRCPGSGVQPYIAADRAASLTADYRLPSEGLYE